MLPKYIKNRDPNKHAIFQQFWFDFCCLLQRPNIKIRAPSQCFVDFSHISHVRFSRAFWSLKTYQKPFQNEVRTIEKSMLKMCCFSTSNFSGFGLDLGASWASKMEPSWPFWPPDLRDLAPKNDLKLDVFKKWRLGGFQTRFWRPRGSILDSLGSIFSKILHCFFQVSPPRIPPAIYNAKNAKNAKKAKKANHLQGANAKSATTKVCFITMAWAKKGGRRWSPPGGYN